MKTRERANEENAAAFGTCSVPICTIMQTTHRTLSPPFAFPVSPTRMDLAGDSSGAGVTTAGFVLAPVLAVETGFFAGVGTRATGLVLAPVSTGAAAIIPPPFPPMYPPMYPPM